MGPFVYTWLMATKCAIWARVSTDEQDTGNQLADLRKWAARRGFEITAEYVLEGESAWNGKHREQLRQALTDARLGKFEVMLVWALDRLSREGVEATLGLLRQFREQRHRGVVAARVVDRDQRPEDGRAARLHLRVDGGRGVPAPQRAHQGGLERRKREDPDFRPGRQRGAKDTKPRKRSGYVARWEREREAQR